MAKKFKPRWWDTPGALRAFRRAKAELRKGGKLLRKRRLLKKKWAGVLRASCLIGVAKLKHAAPGVPAGSPDDP